MAGLTVAEKQHWKEAIERRIDRRIEAIAADSPGLIERVRREAKQRAMQSLGLAGPQAELDAIAEQRRSLDAQERRTQREMVARIRGVAAAEVPECACYGYHFTHALEEAVRKRQEAHEQELLGADPVGRGVLRLRAERERLLDVVWLSVSPREIRALWSRVGALLGDEPTDLEREALAISPDGGG
jgi:hypothetical protein